MNSELSDLDKKIKEKKEELFKVEKELSDKKFAILALVKREEKLYALKERLIELYKKAGIEINID